MEESMNYDIKVWDRLGYETEYRQEGWSLSVYSILEEGASFGSGEFVSELALTEEEWKALTLGVASANGGDYTPDSDFWIDLESFFVTYSNMPTRVEAFLRSLYDQEGVRTDEMLSLWQELSTRIG